MAFEWGEFLDEVTTLEERLEGLSREFGLTLILETLHTPTVAYDVTFTGEVTFDLPAGYAIKIMTSTVVHAVAFGGLIYTHTEQISFQTFLHTGLGVADNLVPTAQEDPAFEDENFVIAYGADLMAKSGTPANFGLYNVKPHQIALGDSGIIPPLNRILYGFNHKNLDTGGANATSQITFVTVTFGIVKLTAAIAARRVWKETNED